MRGSPVAAATAAAAAAVMLAALTACHRHPIVVAEPPSVTIDTGALPTAPRPRRSYESFWRAINDANTAAAASLATNDDQRRYADALSAMLAGRATTADSLVRVLRSASDTVVRRAADITYGALLGERADWAALQALDAADIIPDNAGFHAWASAFARTHTSATFTDSTVTLPFARTRSGAPLITVVVNGRRKQFWLDTGSSITIMSATVAAECAVTPIGRDTLELLTAIGRLPARPAAIGTLQTGPLALRDLPAMLVSADALTLRSGERFREEQTTIDGIIGFDVIRQLDLTLDDTRGIAILRRPTPRATDPRRPRNLFWFGIPIVSAVTDRGAVVHFSFDTGADETYVTHDFLGKTGARARAAERRTLHGFGGRMVERGYVIPDVRLTIGETALRMRRVFLYEAEYPTIFELDGTLGADVGRGAVMRIDMTNGRLDVTR